MVEPAGPWLAAKVRWSARGWSGWVLPPAAAERSAPASGPVTAIGVWGVIDPVLPEGEALVHVAGCAPIQGVGCRRRRGRTGFRTDKRLPITGSLV